MPVLCRLGFHRRLGRSVRPISGGYHGYCRGCDIGMTKPWNKHWRRATENETLERQAEEEKSAAPKAAGASEPETGSDLRVRRRVRRVRTEPPAVRSVDTGMFPKSHRRKLEDADIRRRAIDLAYYLIRDHGDGAEQALAARLQQPGLTSADRKRLKWTETELAERRKRDRNAKTATPAGER